MNAAELLLQAEAMGIRLVVDGASLRVRPRSRLTPDFLDGLRTHKEELLELLSLQGWPPESVDGVRRTSNLSERFFPLIGKPVDTPDGGGLLILVTSDRVGVALFGGSWQITYFLPWEVRPFNAPAVRLDTVARVH